jgi:hypothetical protein
MDGGGPPTVSHTPRWSALVPLARKPTPRQSRRRLNPHSPVAAEVFNNSPGYNSLAAGYRNARCGR